ncbi:MULTISPECIES: hypothetical protein [Nocardia]|uniref:hypothetical protein n=1 Tax=Nocardia TaxID=1817 RepID=UPI0013002D03|nr:MULTISPECIES: hypothetical protein [Nocardia]
MAAPRKPAASTEVEAPKKGRYATLRDEARGKHKPLPPYEFDGTEPPTLISAPDTVERATALARLIDSKGRVNERDVVPLFESVCGPAFDAVWDVIKDEPMEVLFPLFADINSHFAAIPEEGDDLPGNA